MNILHTDADTYNWVQLELVSPKMVSGIEVINRVDCCGNRLKDLEIRAGLESVPSGTTGNVLLKQNKRVGYFTGPGVNGKTHRIMFTSPTLGKFITLQLIGGNSKYLAFSEIKVLGSENKGKNNLK